MVWSTAPDFNNSIFTYDPIFPEEVQSIAWVVPRTQLSPPFGEVTVMDDEVGEEVDPVMAKLLLLVSEIDGLLILVTRIL